VEFPGLRPFHHVGLGVADLQSAISHAISAFGAGPFFLVEHMELATLAHEGRPAHLDHSAAFGQWGPVMVELQPVHDASPPSLAAALCPGGETVGHVAWLVDSLEPESERLVESGLPLLTVGGNEHMSTAWHDGRAVFGQHVELIERSDAVLGFYERIAAAAREWDGSDPVRRP
jgi:hypothetical protein